MKEKAGVTKPPMTPNTKLSIYMFLNERCEGRKKEASKVKQTNKAKQHSTPKAVTFPRKNELPRVGLEPTTLYTLDRALYHVREIKKKGRKKQARSNKQTRQSNTAHPRQSLFLEKMSCLGWDSNPRHSIL